jgi:DNA invertase Pin-like site-specific DNA recombinase
MPIQSTKIKLAHLDRQAAIYIRQSTVAQVRENIWSAHRQYDLVKLAEESGWPPDKIMIIDQDQGRSGSTLDGRTGFKTMVSEIVMGNIGAVCCLEVSRLARNCSDWHQLLELCDICNTLIIDAERVYDPRNRDDRLILGIKGTLSENETYQIKDRLNGGVLAKARQGLLKVILPVGYVRGDDGRVIFDPNEEVRNAIRLVFDLFDQNGSAMSVVKHFTKNGLDFPKRHCVSNNGLEWTKLSTSRVRLILHNPTYAGTYVYGRSSTIRQAKKDNDGNIKSVKKRPVSHNVDDWAVVIHDAFEGYITWEQFSQNAKQLNNNLCRRDDTQGAPRAGSALIQGMMRCGKCGKRMSVCYPKGRGKHLYVCSCNQVSFGEQMCQVVNGPVVDNVIVQQFLRAIEPAQLELSLSALDQLAAKRKTLENQWKLQCERAEYEALLAYRRYTHVEPENRLVARNLEHEWEDKLIEVERVKKERPAIDGIIYQSLTQAEQQAIVKLTQDVPAIWNSVTTTQVERKQLLRLAIDKIIITRDHSIVKVEILWKTGTSTHHVTDCPTAPEAQRVSPKLIEMISTLAKTHTDRQITEYLNEAGWVNNVGNLFTVKGIQKLRGAYKIPICSAIPSNYPNGRRGDGRYGVTAVAELLNINYSTVIDWCVRGKLDGIQEQRIWWIRLTPEMLAVAPQNLRYRTDNSSVQEVPMEHSGQVHYE